MPISGLEISKQIQVLTQKVHFVCGKGGVGKSTVAELLAAFWAGQGQRVLLAKVNGAGAGMDPRLRGEDRFIYLNLTPTDALKAYMGRKLATRLAYKVLMQNKAVQSFINFVPGLDELVMMGQLIHIAEHGDESGPFDRIIVDCPSTGHGIRFLNVARVAQEGAKMGPIAQEAGKMAEFLCNPQKCLLHIVALPEELPVSEAMELMGAIESKETVPIGPTWVNGVLEPVSGLPCAGGAPSELAGGRGRPDEAIIEFRGQLEAAQRREIERLEKRRDGKPVPLFILPRLFTKGHSPVGGLLEYLR